MPCTEVHSTCGQYLMYRLDYSMDKNNLGDPPDESYEIRNHIFSTSNKNPVYMLAQRAKVHIYLFFIEQYMPSKYFLRIGP